MKIDIRSEIGELEGVILHRPGPEVENMTPKDAERALYSDILNLAVVQDEYRQLENLLNAVTRTYQVRDLLESTLKTFDGPANCSALKNRMLNIDSAFDEKNLGFKGFTAFVKAVDGIELVQDDKTWSAFFDDSETDPRPLSKKTKKVASNPQELDSTERYRRVLRKKNWRSIPATMLARCYTKMQDIGTLPKSDLLETIVTRCDGSVTTADVNKASQLLYKAGLMRRHGANEEGEVLWQVSPVSEAEMLQAVDRAMMVRLLAGLEETNSHLKRKHLSPLLLGHYNDGQIQTLLEDASRLSRNGNGQD